MAQAFKEERMCTAICCPGKNEDFNKYVRAGRFAVLGIGSWKCLQCDHQLTEVDQYDLHYGTTFPAILHLRRHLANSGCPQSQGLSHISKPPQKDLYDAVAYKVDNLINKLQREDDSGMF